MMLSVRHRAFDLLHGPRRLRPSVCRCHPTTRKEEMTDHLVENVYVLATIRDWMNCDYDEDAYKQTWHARHAYDSADDNGKAAIDWMLIAVCGFMFPTLWRMATEPEYNHTKHEENAAQRSLRAPARTILMTMAAPSSTSRRCVSTAGTTSRPAAPRAPVMRRPWQQPSDCQRCVLPAWSAPG